MNIQKLIAIVVAIAINCAVLGWFHAWATPVAAPDVQSTRHPEKVLVLPAVNVHPSAAQLRALRRERAVVAPKQASVGTRYACFVMPYYSFADRSLDCAAG
ncbi:MAG TPA: hypothetical protein VFP92_05855 [Rhodanobacteraceae bacterium]|nr:hypothetical protein [Rhodanobacteraceae bacterium]